MAMSPAVAGAASAAPPQTTTNQQPQPDQGAAGDPMQALVGQIRQVAQGLDQIAQSAPTAAPIIQQIKQQLRQIIVQAAAAQQQQSPSAQALPMGGQ